MCPALLRWAVGSFILLGCSAGPRVVRVVATDYALQAPDSVHAGLTQFVVENRGKVPHEMVFGLLRAGKGLPEMVAAARENVRLRLLSDRYLEGPPYGAVFAWPSATSPARLTVDLRKGQRYALLCTLRDSTESPQHAALGMVRVLSVE
jgi:hypothetical protein